MAAPRKHPAARSKRTPAATLKNLYRRLRARKTILSDALWSQTLRTSRYARALPEADRERLRELGARFISTKSFEGAAGLAVTDPMRARIALHACLPVLNLGLDYYSEWVSIVIYPGDFRVHDEYMDEDGVVHQEIKDLCGQSQAQGPMVLSWEAIREEDAAPSDHDLVIHECAHKLDILNGEANGFPPLHGGMKAREWSRDFHAAYDRLGAELDAGKESRIDPYAAGDPAEFFAVMSETFFAAPRLVYEDFPAVYKQLQRFYRQDPYAIASAKRS